MHWKKNASSIVVVICPSGQKGDDDDDDVYASSNPIGATLGRLVLALVSNVNDGGDEER